MDVSVIIPAYNAESTINNAVRSIISAASTFQVEIIIVDDSSNDATLLQIEHLQKLYKNITLLKNVRKAGPAGARNTGILHAKGSFVAFLDADDIWYANHLVDSLKILNEQKNVDAILNNQDVVSLEYNTNLGDWLSKFSSLNLLQKKPLGKNLFLVESNLANYLLGESFLHVQSIIIRRQSLMGILFDESLIRSEDRDFGIQLSLKELKFVINLCSTGIYYESKKGISSGSIENDYRMVCDRIYVLNKYFYYESQYIDRRLLRKHLAQRYLQQSYLLRKKGNKSHAFSAVLKSIYLCVDWKQLSELLKIVLVHDQFNKRPM